MGIITDIISGTTISGGTFYGDGSGLTDVSLNDILTASAILGVNINTSSDYLGITAIDTFDDESSNYISWTNGSNQGTGFNPWVISTQPNTGVFLGNPASDGMGTTGIGTNAFALFATDGSNYVSTSRTFTTPLSVGEVFSFYWAINFDANGGNKGFDLKAGGVTIFNANNNNTSTITSNLSAPYNVVDGGYGTTPMLVTLTRDSSTQYTITITSRSGGPTYSAPINSSLAINELSFYCGAQSDGSGQRNLYFNKLQITQNVSLNKVSVDELKIALNVGDILYSAGTGTDSTVRVDNGNFANGNCSIVAGGSGNISDSQYSTIGGGCNNTINNFTTNSNYYSVVGNLIGGGNRNTIDSNTLNDADVGGSVIGGGYVNQLISPFYGFNTVNGGVLNRTFFDYSTIGGGAINVNLDSFTTIGGGAFNTNSSYTSTIGGGNNNTIGTLSSYYNDPIIGQTIGGGSCNTMSSYSAQYYNGGSTISGGYCNTTVSSYYGGQTISGGFNNITSSDYATVGGGVRNTSSGYYSTVSGGINNTSSCGGSFIGGGCNNTSSCNYSTVSGGYRNTSSCCNSTIGGGRSNTVSSCYSTVSGGRNNVSGISGTISGIYDQTYNGGTFSGYYGSYSPTSTSSGFGNGGTFSFNFNTGTLSNVYVNTIGQSYVQGDTLLFDGTLFGGSSGTDDVTIKINVTSSGNNSTVSGGYCNTSIGSSSTVSGGKRNTSSGSYSTIGGGNVNTSSCYYSTVGGGRNNTSSDYCSTIGGGFNNKINPASSDSGTIYASTIGGGSCNTIGTLSAYYDVYGATIGGGTCNTVGTLSSYCGVYSSTIGGGSFNIISSYSGYYEMYGNTIAGGTFNTTVSSEYNGQTIGGGRGNVTRYNYSTVSGGRTNTSSGYYSTIGGGINNTLINGCSAILGGICNTSQHDCSFIVGSGICSTAANTTHVNCLHFSNIPTSSAGLAPGTVYSDSCVLKIV